MRPIYLLLLFLTAACKETDVNLEIPYAGDRLVLWGKLSARSPVRIQLTRTFHPVGLIPEDVTVPDAEVGLWVDEKVYIPLSPLPGERGIYVSDSLVRAGGSYVVRATVPGLPVAESAPVLVPLAPPEITVTRTRNVAGEINHQTPQDLISLYFAENVRQQEACLTLTFLSHYGDDTLGANPYGSVDNLPAQEKDCHTWAEEKIKTVRDEVSGYTYDRIAPVFLVKSQCLPGPENPVKFYIQAGKGASNGSPQWASRVTMKIGVITKEAYDYAKVRYGQPDGVDLLILPPQNVLTNIKNGYGLISASNEKTVEIR